jgi:hypothetical protein
LTPNLLCLPQVLGHTEWIKDCPNPKFKTLIECEYYFEKKQVPGQLQKFPVVRPRGCSPPLLAPSMRRKVPPDMARDRALTQQGLMR